MFEDKMDDKFNMNILNEMMSQFIELGEQTGTSQIVNNTLKQIDQARSGRQKLKEEKKIWDGYTEPDEQININEHIEEVKKMGKGETKVFTIHHPYYRKKIREVAESLGYKCKSSVNKDIESTYDSKLIIHLWCKKAIPVSKVNWVSDYGAMYGGYMGSEATCPYCDEWFHTDYFYPRNEKDKSRAHYMNAKGKNTITVKS